MEQSEMTKKGFTNPSVEVAREVFKQKSRVMSDKRHTVKEAVKKWIHDGDYLAVGGFGTNRIPTALLHEILRQKVQNLGFSGHTAKHDFQLLCAGNMTGRGQTLARVDIAYVMGMEARGLSSHPRRVLESGMLEITEWTNYALAVRYQAAAMGVPFLPIRSMLGTDTGRFSNLREIDCPFTGQKLAAVPALFPDVVLIHVQEADIYGNCSWTGTSVADLELSRAAKKLIITCEKLVPHEEFRANPNKAQIPFFCVDAVCEVPYGSYPGNMPGKYFTDERYIGEWMTAEHNLDTFKSFLDKYIFGVEDFSEFLHLCGGISRLQELRDEEIFIPPYPTR